MRLRLLLVIAVLGGCASTPGVPIDEPPTVGSVSPVPPGPPPCADLFGASAGKIQSATYMGPFGDAEAVERTWTWIGAARMRLDGRDPYERLGAEPIPRDPVRKHPSPSYALDWGAEVDSAGMAAVGAALQGLAGSLTCGRERRATGPPIRILRLVWQEEWEEGVLYTVAGPAGGRLELRQDADGWLVSKSSFGGGHRVTGEPLGALEALLTVAAPHATAALAPSATECAPAWSPDAEIVSVSIDSVFDIELTPVEAGFAARWSAERFCCIPPPILWRQALGPAEGVIDEATVRDLLRATTDHRSCLEEPPPSQRHHRPPPAKVSMTLDDGTTISATLRAMGTVIGSGEDVGVQFNRRVVEAVGAVRVAVLEAAPESERLWRIVQGQRLDVEVVDATSDPLPALDRWERELERQLGSARGCLSRWVREQEGSVHATFRAAFTVQGGRATGVEVEGRDALRGCIEEGVAKGEFTAWPDGAQVSQGWTVDLWTEADGAALPK